MRQGKLWDKAADRLSPSRSIRKVCVPGWGVPPLRPGIKMIIGLRKMAAALQTMEMVL